MKIMMVGSSWSVGSWAKSNEPFIDTCVGPGIAGYLSQYFEVANFSQRDSFNYGCEEQALLNGYQDYDLILACQNDVFKDLAYDSDESGWRKIKKFSTSHPVSAEAFIRDGVEDLDDLRVWLLNRFYKNMASYGKPVVVYAGAGLVDDTIAQKYGVKTVQPDWCKLLVPEFNSSYVESNYYLGQATELMMDLVPGNRKTIQQQCLEYADQINERLSLYKKYPEFFAYHHPTELGNRRMAEHLIAQLKLYGH